MSSPTPGARSTFLPPPLLLRRKHSKSALGSSSPRTTPGRTLLAPPPACLNRYSSATPGPTSSEDLPHLRFQSKRKLQSAWDDIYEKYKDVDPDLEDEIDIQTGRIVVDRGKLRGLEAREFGEAGDSELEEENTRDRLTSEPGDQSDTTDEDELGGWDEKSGLDLQVLDPGLLSLVESAAVAQRQWTEADKDDLDEFLSAERRRLPPKGPSLAVASDSEDAAAPELWHSPSTPGRRLRRTTYSEKPEGFFSPEWRDSESEDELSVYRPSSGVRRLAHSASLPSMASSPNFDDFDHLPSSPSASRGAFADCRSRSFTGLSARAREKLPEALSTWNQPAAALSGARRSDSRSAHRVERSSAASSRPSLPTARIPLLRIAAPGTPRQGAPKAIPASTSSLTRDVRRLSVRFSPVVINYPAVYISDDGQAVSRGALATTPKPRSSDSELRLQTPFVVANPSPDRSTDGRPPPLCSACVAAGGARALAAASCSGSKKAVECEFVIAGRAAEHNRMRAHQAVDHPQRSGEQGAVRSGGVRKRTRVILSPSSDEDEPGSDVFSLGPVEQNSTASSTLVAPVSTRSSPRLVPGCVTGPAVSPTALRVRRARSLAGRLETKTAPSPRLRSASQLQLPVWLADDDSSDDELALTDDRRTQANMELQPRKVATSRRRQSIRPKSSPVICPPLTSIGLPTPPPSYSSQSRFPRDVPARASLHLAGSAQGSPTKRQRRWSLLNRNPQGLSTPAPSKSPTPRHRGVSSAPKPSKPRHV